MASLRINVYSGPSQPLVKVSAYPYYWHLFRWYAVAETPTYFVSTDVDSHTDTLNYNLLQFYPKLPETPAMGAAKETYLGRVYLDWAKYPVLTTSAEGDDAIVRFRDLRFD